MGSNKTPTVAKDPELERQRAEQARIRSNSQTKSKPNWSGFFAR